MRYRTPVFDSVKNTGWDCGGNLGPQVAWGHVQHGAEAGRDRDVRQVRAQLRGHDSGAGLSIDVAAISFLFG